MRRLPRAHAFKRLGSLVKRVSLDAWSYTVLCRKSKRLAQFLAIRTPDMRTGGAAGMCADEHVSEIAIFRQLFSSPRLSC